MFEPNVLNYFLVLLGGFGVVWSYRHTRRLRKELIGEVEYAAFSTLWGIPVFFVFFEATKSRPDLQESMFALPMAVSPILFILGCVAGYFAAKLAELFLILKEHFENK